MRVMWPRLTLAVLMIALELRLDLRVGVVQHQVVAAACRAVAALLGQLAST
jgi:hypothetical protein